MRSTGLSILHILSVGERCKREIPPLDCLSTLVHTVISNNLPLQLPYEEYCQISWKIRNSRDIKRIQISFKKSYTFSSINLVVFSCIDDLLDLNHYKIYVTLFLNFRSLGTFQPLFMVLLLHHDVMSYLTIDKLVTKQTNIS